MDVIDTPTCRDLARVDHMHGLPSCRVRAGRLGRVTSITGIRAAVQRADPDDERVMALALCARHGWTRSSSEATSQRLWVPISGGRPAESFSVPKC